MKKSKLVILFVVLVSQYSFIHSVNDQEASNTNVESTNEKNTSKKDILTTESRVKEKSNGTQTIEEKGNKSKMENTELQKLTPTLEKSKITHKNKHFIPVIDNIDEQESFIGTLPFSFGSFIPKVIFPSFNNDFGLSREMEFSNGIGMDIDLNEPRFKSTNSTNAHKSLISVSALNSNSINNLNTPESHSWSSSRSYSYSNNNGKVKKDMNGMDLEEEHKQNSKNNEPLVHKYGKIFHKKNDNPTLLKEQASSSDEKENLVVKEPDEKLLSKVEEDQMFGNDPFFGSLFRSPKNFGSRRGLNNGLGIGLGMGFGNNHGNGLGTHNKTTELATGGDKTWERHQKLLRRQQALFREQQDLLAQQESLFDNFFERKAGNLRKLFR